jgi:hypothetical protein
MRDWTAEELDTLGAADELEIAALRPDGTLRPATTIRVVRVGDDLNVRSHRRRIRARCGSSHVDPMVSPDATAATLQLIPR